MFHCEDCIHYKLDGCELDYELCIDSEDAWDCPGFSDGELEEDG